MSEDSVFSCSKCKKSQAFSGSRQKFLSERGFKMPPMFCDDCFDERLSEIWEIPGEKRQAVCAGCGIETRLHFVPTQGKPVFCSKCHSTNKEESR